MRRIEGDRGEGTRPSARTSRYAVAGAVLALLASGAGVSHADPVKSPAPVTGGHAVAPENSKVVIGGDGGGIGPQDAVYVGGGTWQKGSFLTGTWGLDKTCFSNYMHTVKWHSSTASIGGFTERTVAMPGRWSYATVYGKRWQRCDTYWSSWG